MTGRPDPFDPHHDRERKADAVNIFRAIPAWVWVALACIGLALLLTGCKESARTEPPGEVCRGGAVYEIYGDALRTQKRMEGAYYSACALYLMTGCVFRDNPDGRSRTKVFFHAPRYTHEDGRVEVGYSTAEWQHVLFPAPLSADLRRNACLTTLDFTDQCIYTGSQLADLGVTVCG